MTETPRLALILPESPGPVVIGVIESPGVAGTCGVRETPHLARTFCSGAGLRFTCFLTWSKHGGVSVCWTWMTESTQKIHSSSGSSLKMCTPFQITIVLFAWLIAVAIWGIRDKPDLNHISPSFSQRTPYQVIWDAECSVSSLACRLLLLLIPNFPIGGSSAGVYFPRKV